MSNFLHHADQLNPKIFLVFLVLTVACSNSPRDENVDPDAGTGSAPDVVGTYFCDDGCGFGLENNEDCQFPSILQLSQTGSSITMNGESENDDWSGTLNDNGQFSVGGEHCDCSGDIADGVLTADCVCDDLSCQDVTYRIIS